MSFESLEDSFIKKANEPIKTDVQSNIDVEKKISTNENDKETYEDKVVKKQVIGGLAALFQEKLQQTKDSDNSNESIFISTENIKYGDKFTDATNYIPDEDVQKYSPIDSYNDSVVEPQITEENSDIDQRHTPNNKYDDTLTFEPSIASEKDILPNSSISKSLNQDAPYSEDEISNKIADHNKQKKKQFSENTWSPNNSYNSGPSFTESKSDFTDTDTVSHETELTREEYERNLKDLQNTETDSE